MTIKDSIGFSSSAGVAPVPMAVEGLENLLVEGRLL